MYSLNSTHSGRTLLWAATELAIFIGLIPIFVQWMRADERAGAELTPGRPGRKGHGTAPDGTGRAGLGCPLHPGHGLGLGHGRAVPPALPTGQWQGWEELWKAKAGFVPSTSGRPGAGRSGPPQPAKSPRARQPGQPGLTFAQPASALAGEMPSGSRTMTSTLSPAATP